MGVFCDNGIKDGTEEQKAKGVRPVQARMQENFDLISPEINALALYLACGGWHVCGASDSVMSATLENLEE